MIQATYVQEILDILCCYHMRTKNFTLSQVFIIRGNIQFRNCFMGLHEDEVKSKKRMQRLLLSRGFPRFLSVYKFKHQFRSSFDQTKFFNSLHPTDIIHQYSALNSPCQDSILQSIIMHFIADILTLSALAAICSGVAVNRADDRGKL